MTDRYDSLIGIPWYRPERYDDARRRMADADLIPDSYDVWRERAEKREQDTVSAGKTPRRVYVDDDLFVDYCGVKNLILDGKARSQYALDFCTQVFKPNVADHSNPGFWPGPIPRRRRRH